MPLLVTQNQNGIQSPAKVPERKSFLNNPFTTIPLGMRLSRIICLFLLFTIAIVPGAWAHARLVRAEPKSAAELSAAPKRIELWFNELLEDGFNTVKIFPAADLVAEKQRNFAKGKPQVDAKDRTHIIVDLTSMPPGEYIVEWRVLSRDGHSAPGRSTFRVRTP
jgi:copper transport protein